MRNVLEGLGLSKEVQDSVMAEYGKNIARLQEENKNLKKENEDLTKKVESIPDVNKIKKEQFDLGKEEGLKELTSYKQSKTLDDALKSSKVKDIKILKSLIDSDAIKYEEKDGEFVISGLDEQISKIKESHDYLFEVEKAKEEPKKEEAPVQRISTGAEHKEVVKSEPTSLLAALKEQYK